MSLIAQQSNAQDILERIRSLGLEAHNVSKGILSFIDITNGGVNKGTSLQKIMKLEEADHVIGFGSGCNDISFM